ncbi:MAG: Bpu10I family restriction endonuclease [Chloroflexi bacterium]|nr:Bpu10I family restriction endonuclease [Chloroflexota bacterium]
MLVHGSNISQKENHRTKYLDSQSRKFLAEIRVKYDQWHLANKNLEGPYSNLKPSDNEVVHQRVALLENYKSFIDQQKYAENFDSRSNLHSTVIEEFLYYLFRDLVSNFGSNALLGRSHAFKDVFFVPPNFRAMTERAYARIERKDHDFVIGVTLEASLKLHQPKKEQASQESQLGEPPIRYTVHIEDDLENHLFDVAAVAIECKTYLDKTMLEGSSRAAEQLKARNPNALYMVAMEWLKLTSAVNLRKYEVDQIYVFRKQKNTDREFRFAPDYEKNLIDPEVVWHLYQTVRTHLITDWESTIEQGLERGWLL